jgi:hypothetical protein
MDVEGYRYDRKDFALLMLRKFFPERTDGESWVIKAYLEAHLSEYDAITFAKRVGRGITPNPEHLAAVQQGGVFSSLLKIDILAWRGNQPVLIEVKQHVTPASLGQILTYRFHFMQEFPDAPEPELIVVGRDANEDAVTALQAHNITVYLYPNAHAP